MEYQENECGDAVLPVRQRQRGPRRWTRRVAPLRFNLMQQVIAVAAKRTVVWLSGCLVVWVVWAWSRWLRPPCQPARSMGSMDGALGKQLNWLLSTSRRLAGQVKVLDDDLRLDRFVKGTYVIICTGCMYSYTIIATDAM
ncbi:hypothetical protein GGR53DRAFT_490674 [Hypoxylon sp. FL1150]|nr:hypothetical protein GGR53DRAFT_490674 [Hypoxylon sp. FL1150]